ncbi:MAG: DegV family protein [Chloroflexota bacterium]
MSKVAVVADSTAYVPADLVSNLNIRVAPLLVNWDGQSYRDGVDMQPVAFYERLKKSKSMPTSSQVPVAAFEEVFRQLLEQGYDVLAVTISSRFSGTLDSAVQAKAAMPPDAPIELVDSLSAAGQEGLVVLAAARAAQEGLSLAECKSIAERVQANSGLFLTVETLEFLHRGGRIGGASRFLGTALNIKPIMEIVEGKISAVERVRTRNKAVARMVELVENRIAGRKPVRLFAVHANAEAEARVMLDQATQKLGAVEGILSDVSPVIGVHVGPGTLGLGYSVEW